MFHVFNGAFGMSHRALTKLLKAPQGLNLLEYPFFNMPLEVFKVKIVPLTSRV